MRDNTEPPVDQTPAGLLQMAAHRVRQTGPQASPGPWVANGAGVGTDWTQQPDVIVALDCGDPDDAEWIALMHPGLRDPLAAWLEFEADRAERHTSEDVPDCCGEEHTDSGLLHIDGCGDWLTVYRDHDGGDMACHCWDRALAMARAILGRPS